MGDYVTGKVARIEARFSDTEFKKYLDLFKFDCFVRNLTPKTLDGYFERLGYLFVYLQKLDIRFENISKQVLHGYILSLKGHVSDETINGRIRVYRCFFNYLVGEGIWERENPMVGISLLKTAKTIKPVIDPDNVQKIIGSLSRKTFEGNRNMVLILLLWDGMLRKREALGLKVGDIDLETRLMKVYGKGGKERMVPVGVKTLRMLHQYLVR